MKNTAILILFLMQLSLLVAADQAQYEQFISNVRQCCEKHDVEGLKKLYYFEGTPDVIIDQEIYDWEQIITDLAGGKGEYVGEEHYNLKDIGKIRQPPEPFRISIEGLCQPVVMNGATYKPNLKIVGIVNVKFSKDSVIRWRPRPVGIAPDGTMRFVAKTVERANQALLPTPTAVTRMALR